MSLMAGFDLVVEISKETLLKLLKSRLTIGNAPANPPFELTVPLSQGGVSGIAHLIVTDLLLDLNGDDTLTLTLPFYDSSVIIQGPARLTITALDGLATITAPVTLNADSRSTQRLACDLSTANVTVQFSPTSQVTIASALSGSAVTLGLFGAFATQALTSYVQALGTPTFGPQYGVVSGVNGELSSTPLQFERLEVHCINNSALGIFGILLLANDGNGDHTQKTTTAITQGHDICVSLSPGAFHSLVFCPKIARQFNLLDQQGNPDVSRLPTSCGRSGPISTPDASVTNISDSFGNGHIDINGSIAKVGLCYHAEGSFHASITFSANTLRPQVRVERPRLDVSVDWWCWLGALAVGGVVGVIVTGIVDAIANSIADNLATSAVNGALGNLSTPDVSGGAGASFDAIAISPEGLTVEGSMSILPLPTPAPSLSFGGSVVTSSTKIASTGAWQSTICPVGPWPFTVLFREQVATYEVVTTLFGQPLDIEWSISPLGGGRAVNLIGTNGSAEIVLEMHDPFPLPSGYTGPRRTFIQYSKSGSTIQLNNRWDHGNYSLVLSASVRDPAGNVAAASAYVSFEGEVLEFHADFYQQQRLCLIELWNGARVSAGQDGPQSRFPLLPAGDAPPEELAAWVSAVIASQTPKAEEILAIAAMAYGSAFQRARLTMFARPQSNSNRR